MKNSFALDTPTETAQGYHPKPRHHLYEIDLEKRTAFCTVCGYTEIHVTKTRTARVPKVFCDQRFRDIKEARKEKKRLEPGGKPAHLLSQIDAEKMTAACSICGQTKIRKRMYKGTSRYACAAYDRWYSRKYRRTHYSSRKSGSLVHVLSQFDEDKGTAVCSLCGPVSIYMWKSKRKIGRRCPNASVQNVPIAQEIRRETNLNMINRHKVEHGCKRCGYNENILLLSLYSGRLEKKELKIDSLLRLTSKDLTQELQICEVFCINCRSFVNYELALEALRSIMDYSISPEPHN